MAEGQQSSGHDGLTTFSGFIAKHVGAAVTVLVSVGTVLAYATAYYSLRGKCDVTGMPPALLDVSWGDAASALQIILSIVLGFATMAGAIALAGLEPSWALSFVIATILSLTDFVISQSTIGTADASFLQIGGVLLASFGTGILLSRLAQNPRKRRLMINCLIMFAVAMTILHPFLARFMARTEFQARDSFFVIDQSAARRELVVLHINPTRAVAAPLDRKARTFRREFVVIELKDSISLRWEKLGELHPEDVRSEVRHSDETVTNRNALTAKLSDTDAGPTK